MTVFLSTLVPGVARAESGGGGRWSVDTVVSATDVRCLAADPGRPTIVWAGTQGAGVMRSDDAGRTFQQAGLDGRIVKSMAVSPGGRVYAGTKPPLLFTSDDDGRTWTELVGFRRVRRFFWLSPAESPFTAYVQAIALDGEVVVAGIEAGAVVRSADGGRTWQGHRRGALRDCHSLASLPGRFFEGGGTGGGAAFSVDGGVTWRRPPEMDRTYGWSVAADPGDPNLWYVSIAPGIRAHSNDADAAIYRFRDSLSSERLSGGLPQPMNFMPYALLPGPEPNRLTAGLSSGELWESHDRGDSWRPLPVRLPKVERAMIRLDV
jgi:hypothetical protein